MDDDRDLRDFSDVTRLFPLPNVVLFPHAILPLHIFEPRYRQMTEDALAADNFVTIVNLRSTAGETSIGTPPVERIGCLGRILQYERLEDGRFNFLLLGRKRVRLIHEVPGDKLYRIAKVEIIEDRLDAPLMQDDVRASLVELSRAVFQYRHSFNDELDKILQTAVPLGALADIIAHALGLPPVLRQVLLNESNVRRRVDTLLTFLRHLVANDPELNQLLKPFPPPFSAN